MDFFKKAKQTMKELEGDLNKATAQLDFGDKSQSGAQAPVTAEPASSNGTPATSNVNTPSTLTARRLVRDDYETMIPELEANLSSVLGQPWKINFDPGYLYTFADDRYSKEHPGQMFTEYELPALRQPRPSNHTPTNMLSQ